MVTFEGSPEQTGLKKAADFIANVDRSFDQLKAQSDAKTASADLEKSFEQSFASRGIPPEKAAAMAKTAAQGHVYVPPGV